MKHLVLLFGILNICIAEDYHSPVRPLRRADVQAEDEEMNTVDEDPNQLNIKLISHPPVKVTNTEQYSTDTITTSTSDRSTELLDTSTLLVTATNGESLPDPVPDKDTVGKPYSDNSPEGSDLTVISQTEVVVGGAHDGQLSDVPAEEPSVFSDHSVGDGSAETYGTPNASTGTETSTYIAPDPDRNLSTGPIVEATSEHTVTLQDEAVQPGDVFTPARSTARPYDERTTHPYVETTEPEKTEETTEITYNVEDMNRRKTPSVSTTTEKVPQQDTPPYPLIPSIPTDEEGILLPRPPIRKGQLDIRISIPHIFHLSLGDTPDGRRRLGIQAPFFRFDLTKPWLKVFHK